VSEPDIRSAQEAYDYLTEVRKLVRYLEICDGNMEEGSMRCDANVSVRLKGAKEFGERTETKNLNSIRNVFRAIEYEFKRQIEVLEAGGSIKMETMGFDAVTGTTSTLRSKEMAHDYRYFPEPDLQAVYVDSTYVNSVKKDLPALPNELIEKFTQEMNLSSYDAEILTEEKYLALYFDELTTLTKNYKAAANWVMGAIKSHLNENALTIQQFPIKPDQIAEIIQMIDDGKISNSIANQKIFPYLIEQPTSRPNVIAEENNWIQESDSSALEEFIDAALAKFPDKVAAYKGGNKNLLGLFMGDVMKSSKGKADPKLTNQLLREKLEN
jgi:aspartyl-tRNA(Asn)/glutamyl-tRNA(Gln) amidotransferase subunit B